MSVTTYAELQTAVTNWLARDDLTAQVPEFIALAEARMTRRLRLRAMEKAFSTTISSGTVAVPTDWLEWEKVWVVADSGSYPLEPATLESLLSLYPTRSGSGVPKLIARQVGSFVFGPYPGDYTVNGVYYAALTPLSPSNTTNWFLTNAPDAYLWGALAEAAGYLIDAEREAKWLARFEACLQELRDQDRRHRLSGGTPTARAL